MHDHSRMLVIIFNIRDMVGVSGQGIVSLPFDGSENLLPETIRIVIKELIGKSLKRLRYVNFFLL